LSAIGLWHETPLRPANRLDLEWPRSGGSMWPWLAALVAIVAILGLAIGYARIFAILLNQVEGIDGRFMRGLSSAQILKP
jgi:uncharacterized membrane protein